MLGLPVVAWFDHLLRQAGLAELVFLNAVNIPEVVGAVSAATAGAVLVSRRPSHPVGWLLLGIGLLVPVSGITYGYVHYGVMARPRVLPAAGYLAGFPTAMTGMLVALGSFIPLLTPSGSLPSPRWRWWARVAGAATVVLPVALALDPRPLYPEDPTFANPLTISALRDLVPVAQAAGMVIVLGAPAVAAGSLVVRFRRAGGVERQQLRWLAFAAAVAAVAILVAVAAAVLGRGERVVIAALGTCVAVLPLATGAAILRYRLYDLDRIISRTLAYGLLTVLLGGCYAAVVLGLGQVLGQGSSLVVATSTLAVAAVFQPARRRIQRVVDRRFNRRRYDAAQMIQAFSARLREQVDLDTISAELLAVVEQTMQPAQVSLWLRPVPRSQVSAADALTRHPALARTGGPDHPY